MSEKIKTQHLERKAILYIRQSSAYQVIHNLESRKLQYAMQDRLRQFGWREIEVVDEDLGRSAAGTVTRAGFERMVSEVCLGKVGAVAAREVSRFARNSREWQQLVEVCRVVDTVLIDQEAVYSPRQGNDRLLLGLKGSLNEYELDLLRQRSHAWRLRLPLLDDDHGKDRLQLWRSVSPPQDRPVSRRHPTQAGRLPSLHPDRSHRAGRPSMHRHNYSRPRLVQLRLLALHHQTRNPPIRTGRDDRPPKFTPRFSHQLRSRRLVEEIPA